MKVKHSYQFAKLRNLQAGLNWSALFLATVSALCLAGCTRGQVTDCLSCAAAADPRACALQHCTGGILPPLPTATPSPTVSPAPTVTATDPTSAPGPTPTATPTAGGPTEVPVQTTNCGPAWPDAKGQYAGDVAAAVQAVKTSHPEWFLPGGGAVVGTATRAFDFEVRSVLAAAGIDAVVDSCGCDTIEVAPRGSSAFHEEYALLRGSDKSLRPPAMDGFRMRCVPRGFPILGAMPEPTFTPAPTPTAGPAAVATPDSCPALQKMGVSLKGAEFPVDGLVGQWTDRTGRFLCRGNPDGCPDNKDHHAIGTIDGDDHADAWRQCEPVDNGVRTTFESGIDRPWGVKHNPADPPNVYRGYEVGIVGKKGAHWRITVDIRPGAMGKDGKPVVTAFGYQGTRLEGTF